MPAAALKAAAASGGARQAAAAAATKKLGGHNSDYVSHNSLLDRVTHALHSTQLAEHIHTHTQENLFTFDAPGHDPTPTVVLFYIL